MYMKDKNHRITLRLNDDQFAYVALSAERLDVSPSEFLRMVVNSAMFAQKEIESQKADLNAVAEKVTQNAVNQYLDLKGGQGRENDEADQHNIV